MSGPDPVDFAAARAARDSAIRLGRVQAERLVGSIVRSVDRWAERVGALSVPLLSVDAEAARALNVWGARRLRAECRRTLGDIAPDARADLIATAEIAFTEALVTRAGHPPVGGGGQ